MDISAFLKQLLISPSHCDNRTHAVQYLKIDYIMVLHLVLSKTQLLKLWSRCVFGPFIGAGIRVTKATPDFCRMEVRMKLKWYNKNYVGTHYGGSMFSMTDPFYMLMLIQVLGKDYLVWDKSAKIEFLKPGKTELCTKFVLTDEIIADIISKTKDGNPYFAEFSVDVTDTEGAVVARADKIVYIRKKKITAAN